MRILLAADLAAAKEAIDLFVYRIGRELGSLAVALGGLDGLSLPPVSASTRRKSVPAFAATLLGSVSCRMRPPTLRAAPASREAILPFPRGSFRPTRIR